MIDDSPFTLEEAEEIAEDFEDLVDTEFTITASGIATEYIIDALMICPFPEAGRQQFIDEYYSTKDGRAALAQYEGDEYDVILFVSEAADMARFSYLSIRAFAMEQGIKYSFPTA